MKLGIFTAMEKESRSFLQCAQEKIKVGRFDVFKLALGKHEAYLCCPPTVGEIAASAACQMLISHFGVQAIINFGVVGSLTHDVSVLSTVFVNSVVHYAMDTAQIDDVPVGRYLCFENIWVDCDANLIQKALQVQNLPTVRCASADKFVVDVEEKSYLSKTFDAQICDMESAGVLFSCKFNNVPCLLIKCVSDSLVGGYGEYEQNAEKAAQGFFAFAQKLAELL